MHRHGAVEQADRQRLLLDRDGEIIPARRAAVGLMVDAAARRAASSAHSAPRQSSAHRSACRSGRRPRALRRARHQPQHGAHEIMPGRRHRPRRCARSARRIGGAHSLLAGQLGRAIDAERRGRVHRAHRGRRAVPSNTKSVETWTKRAPQRPRRRRQMPGPCGIDAIGLRLVALAPCRRRYRRPR